MPLTPEEKLEELHRLMCDEYDVEPFKGGDERRLEEIGGIQIPSNVLVGFGLAFIAGVIAIAIFM